MKKATLERFDHDIRGHKFVNYMGKVTFLWVDNEVTYRFF